MSEKLTNPILIRSVLDQITDLIQPIVILKPQGMFSNSFFNAYKKKIKILFS